MKFGTKAVHAGVKPDPTTGSIMTPIYQTSTYVQNAPGDHKGFEYARTQNPTRHALEESLAIMENGNHGVCFASGMSAMDAVIKLLKSGDHVLCCNDLYGGSYRLLRTVYNKFGIQSDFIDMADLDAVSNGIKENTRLLWLETPTNPLINLIDIKAVAAMGKERGILVCVDNTFATPFLQNPLDLGADLITHSITKYIAGHSDVVMGAVVVNDEDLADQLRFIQNGSGAVPGPQDCFLTLRGIKTLHLRMQRSCENASTLR